VRGGKGVERKGTFKGVKSAIRGRLEIGKDNNRGGCCLPRRDDTKKRGKLKVVDFAKQGRAFQKDVVSVMAKGKKGDRRDKKSTYGGGNRDWAEPHQKEDGEHNCIEGK